MPTVLVDYASFEELRAQFTQDLLEFERLAGNWPGTIEERHVKEQEIELALDLQREWGSNMEICIHLLSLPKERMSP